MLIRNFLFLIALATPTIGSTSMHSSQTFKGEYFYNFEWSVLTPEGTTDRWCVSGDMSKAELPATDSSGPWGTADVEILGALGPAGHFGNLGACTRVLTVQKLIHVRNRKPRQ